MMAALMDSISQQLAREAPFTGDAGQDSEVFKYAIKILLLNASALGGIVLIAWFLGMLPVTLTIWAAAFSLRVFAGGRHRSNPVTCWILTVTVFAALGYLVTNFAPALGEYVLPIVALGLVLSLFAVITTAPVLIASKEFSMEKRRRLKMASVAVVVFWATAALAPMTAVYEQPLFPLGITAGLLSQSLSILPMGLKR